VCVCFVLYICFLSRTLHVCASLAFVLHACVCECAYVCSIHMFSGTHIACVCLHVCACECVCKVSSVNVFFLTQMACCVLHVCVIYACV